MHALFVSVIFSLHPISKCMNSKSDLRHRNLSFKAKLGGGREIYLMYVHVVIHMK